MLRPADMAIFVLILALGATPVVGKEQQREDQRPSEETLYDSLVQEGVDKTLVGKYSLALKPLNRAISLKPDKMSALYFRACVYKKRALKKIDERDDERHAKDDFKKVTTLSAKTPDEYIHRAIAFAELGSKINMMYDVKFAFRQARSSGYIMSNEEYESLRHYGAI